MKINKTLLGAAVLSASVAPAIFAQETLDETVVTATRTAQPLDEVLSTTDVISRAEIERLQPTDVLDLLARTSGIRANGSGSRGSTSSLFIRGTHTSQVVVLIDGVRSASATTGATALESIPVESIERIEIVKGPNSGLYGADAVGGVVQVFTRKGRGKSFQPSIKVRYGSHDTRQYTGSLSGGNNDGHFYLAFSSEETDGIDSTSLKTGGNDDRDGFEENSVTFNGAYQLSDDLKGQLSYLKSDGRAEFDNVFGVDEGRYLDKELENISLKLDYQLSQQINTSLAVGTLTDHLMTPAFGSDIKTRRNNAVLQTDITVADYLLITLGADYYQDEVVTLDNFDETERDNRGLFAQWQAQTGDWSMVTNVRYDSNDAYGSDTNGSFSVGYAFSDTLSLVGSYGKAFKAPTFNQLYYPGFGNTELQPEESESFELSLRGEQGDFSWRLNGYRTEVNNLINTVCDAFWNCLPENVDTATLQGGELELSYQLNNWSFDANIDYLSAHDDSTGDFLKGRSRVSSRFTVGRQFDALFLLVDIEADSGRFDRGQKLGGYGLLGFSAVYDVNEQLELTGRINNLFDKAYVQNLASSTIAYLNEGRTAEVSIRYNF